MIFILYQKLTTGHHPSRRAKAVINGSTINAIIPRTTAPANDDSNKSDDAMNDSSNKMVAPINEWRQRMTGEDNAIKNKLN